MAFTVTPVYNSNDFEPRPSGDLATVIYDVSALASDVYPGATGELVDLSGQFNEVYSVAFGVFGALPGGAPWPTQLIVPNWSINLANTGNLRFFVESDGGAGTPLANLANAVYPFDFRLRMIVVGRPVTDSR